MKKILLISFCATLTHVIIVSAQQNEASRRRPSADQVRDYFETRVANIEGQTNVQVALMEQRVRLLNAQRQYLQEIALSKRSQQRERDAYRAQLVEDAADQRRSNEWQVDIARRLDWPEGLKQPSLAWERSEMQLALNGAAPDLPRVRELTDSMHTWLRAHRAELGDTRLLAAKHYLEGIVRASEAKISLLPLASTSSGDR